MNILKGKKAQGSSGMKLIVAAAILIAILFVAWYFITKGSGSVSTATGCGEYDCVKTTSECTSGTTKSGASRSSYVLSTPCKISRDAENKADAGTMGRCCQPNPLS